MAPTSVVQISGDGSISSAGERREALLAALDGSGPIGLDVSGVTQPDITFVQLLASTARSAAALDRPFRLVGVPDALARAFQRSGVALDAETGHLLQI